MNRPKRKIALFWVLLLTATLLPHPGAFAQQTPGSQSEGTTFIPVSVSVVFIVTAVVLAFRSAKAKDPAPPSTNLGTARLPEEIFAFPSAPRESPSSDTSVPPSQPER